MVVSFTEFSLAVCVLVLGIQAVVHDVRLTKLEKKQEQAQQVEVKQNYGSNYGSQAADLYYKMRGEEK